MFKQILNTSLLKKKNCLLTKMSIITNHFLFLLNQVKTNNEFYPTLVQKKLNSVQIWIQNI